MKKQITSIFSVLAFALSTGVIAQEAKIKPCVTYAAMEQVFKNDPDALIRYKAAQSQLNMDANSPQAKGAAFEYTIPVVFHILHQGGSENLTDAAVQQALAWMQADFDATASDKSTVVQPFQSMWIDSDIKFMLAHKDPQGNCSSGIMHYYDPRTNWDREGQLYYNSPLYAGITWDPTKYLNIIVVKEIVDDDPNDGDVIGYTFKPGTHGAGDTRDAVVMTAGFMNTFDRTRFMTHEVGHWLNLSHTFGDTNDPGLVCGDDDVCDTPPTKGRLGGCDPSLSGNSCAATATCGYSAGMQNTQNIMDYSDCHKNFTAGQTARMRAALASNISGRSNLWSPTNLTLTHVDGTSNCPPRADFASITDTYTICAGSSLSFKDYSFNGTVSNYLWTADNAVVNNPTTAVTSVIFPFPGTATVNLTVSNNLGSGSKSKKVTVIDAIATAIGPWTESFELGLIPPQWTVKNPNPTSGAFTQSFSAAYDGAGAVVLEGQNSGANEVDELYTPIMDVAGTDLKQLSFAYAYARKTFATNDKLFVEITGDCGATWIELMGLNANTMATNSGGVQASYFIPLPEQWKTVELSSHPSSASVWLSFVDNPHVQVRFRFLQGTSGGGNNFWLDAVNMPSTVGIKEFKSDIGLRVYPNPSEDKINVNFLLSGDSYVKGEVTDLSGRKLISVAEGKYSAGKQSFVLNADNALAKGVYLFNLEVNGVKMTEKVIIR